MKTTKTITLSILISTLLLTTDLFGKVMVYPLQDRARKSDIIVEGLVSKQTDNPYHDTAKVHSYRKKSEVTIKKIHKGKATVGKTITVYSHMNFICDTSRMLTEGKTYLLMLKKHDSGYADVNSGRGMWQLKTDKSGTIVETQRDNCKTYEQLKKNIAKAMSGNTVKVPATDKSADGSIETLIQGNADFAVKLYHELSAEKDNILFSPYSVSSALAMTYGGARGNTAAEMETAMSFKLRHSDLHDAFKKLNDELAANTAKSGQKLNIANGLCLTGGNVSKEFKNLLKVSYDAEIFQGDLDKINSWVEKKTEGKIEKILENLSRDSVCVLLNAIYFKGIWESQFKKDLTRDLPFNISPSKQVKVPMMQQKNDFRMLEKNDFKMISMPYKGKSLSMIVLLPKAVDGLEKLEKELTPKNLNGWLTDLDNHPLRKTIVIFPKYKQQTKYDLPQPCKNLGMKEAFIGGKADFRGMGWPKGAIWISQIKHKAFIEVNEEGTEAAAATAVVMGRSFSRYPTFTADHPFLYMIRDNKTNSILFMGRLVNPKADDSGAATRTETDKIIDLLENADIKGISTKHSQYIHISLKDGTTFFGKYVQPKNGKYSDQSDILNLVMHIQKKRNARWHISCE